MQDLRGINTGNYGELENTELMITFKSCALYMYFATEINLSHGWCTVLLKLWSTSGILEFSFRAMGTTVLLIQIFFFLFTACGILISPQQLY